MKNKNPLWNISILTIPGREEYLKKLIQSLNEQEFKKGAKLIVVYNHDQKTEHYKVESDIRSYSKKLPLSVYFNNADTSISGGRNFQLNISKSPLICFIDDDITVHGDVFPAIENTLQNEPLGLVGVPSYTEDTDALFKPRENTPSINKGNLKFMPVQGMLIAGYRQLFCDIGSFNPRRFYWGEWTEFNLRLLRSGYPTAYLMDRGYLRHWHKAPSSPTRSLSGREKNVLWGLICTAIEYDAVDINEATESFWRLVDERYLVYSFGEELNVKNLLKTTLEIMPRVARHWNDIAFFRQEVEKHRFKFMPFQKLTEQELEEVIKNAVAEIESYRSDAFDSYKSGYGSLLDLAKNFYRTVKSGLNKLKD